MSQSHALFFSSKRAVDESEVEAAERRNLRCVWVTGGRALTEHEAAVGIVSEARLLLQEDLALLGIRWDPATVPPEALDDPDSHRNNVHIRPTSPPEEQVNSTKDAQDSDTGRTRDWNGTDKRETDNEAECKHKNNGTKAESRREQRNSRPGEDAVNTHLDEDRTEQATRQSPDGRGERCRGTKSVYVNDKEDANQPSERQNRELDKGKGVLSLRSGTHQVKHPVHERSLTQELAEIMSSPLPDLMPRPLLSLSPATPPRFRAPVSRIEAQQTVAPSSERRGAKGLVASPVCPGGIKHARVLNKVLHSIQTDRSMRADVQVAPAGGSSVQDPAPGQGSPARVSAPINTGRQICPLPVSPAPTTFPPRAKRRRVDGTEVDAFSSPELYVGHDGDEDVAVKEGESFGDSFELDTQTEKMIVQPASQHEGGGVGGGNRSAVTGDGRNKATDEGRERPERDNGCSGLSISITESQMEFFLDNSQEVSERNVHTVVIVVMLMCMLLQVTPSRGADEGGVREDGSASKALNRSSSFLFESLYDSPPLGGVSPHPVSDKSEEEQPREQGVRQESPVGLADQRRRNELLANQEAEEQEAIRWGESSFSLSEWGDSLLVGEYFLERQSLLKYAEQSLKEHRSRRDEDGQRGGPSEEQTSRPRPNPMVPRTAANAAPPEADRDSSHDDKSANQEKRLEPTGGMCSRGAPSEGPLVQNGPDGTLYCSPGLQEIFDRWPSMSDQPCPNAATHRPADAAAPVLHLPPASIGRISQGGNEHVASDSHEEHLSERPGSANDLIPPTQARPPVTPRVKLTTSSVQSPLAAPPLKQSTPSTVLQRKPGATKRPESHSRGRDNLPEDQTTVTSHSNRKHQQMESLPFPNSGSSTNPKQHNGQSIGVTSSCAPPTAPQHEAPSNVTHLQLSPDASLCCSGTFSIIDVASDRRLFETFISEWKTQERYSLALACEKREPRQQPDGESGRKPKNGNDFVSI